MAERIAYLDKNRYLLKEFGERARQDMLAKSDRKKHIEQWKEILAMME